PMALGGGQAKALCQNLLREAWAEREQARGVLPLRYLYLDPSDRVAITGAGTRQECRLVQTHLGGDLSMEVEGIAFSRTERREQVDADAGAGVPAYAIHRPQMLEPFILDLPLLRDEDALAGTGSRYYFAAAGYGARWNGGGLYSSETGERFTFQDAVDRQVAWGIALNALGEPVTPYRTDWENSLTVRLLHGADQFENIPEADFLNGTNPVLVGQELVQFKSVQDNGDGTITLSTLLRGRRGTDPFAGGHQAGERVFLLDSNTVRRGQVPLSRLLMPLH
ncbi:phage tail baseplate protein, partial [Brevundimonas denitrificans]